MSRKCQELIFFGGGGGDSGVARIFSVGGHWGALGFRRGALKF